MNDCQFDDLALYLADRLHRRRFARMLSVVGLVASPLLGVQLTNEADAKRGKKKNKKKKRCKRGKKRCGRKCVNIRTNPNHCGGCNQACADGQFCASGFCLTSCDNPKTCGAPLNPCPGGGNCVLVDGRAACMLGDSPCTPFGVTSCAGDPCGPGRVCAEVCCGEFDFGCKRPAP